MKNLIKKLKVILKIFCIKLFIFLNFSSSTFSNEKENTNFKLQYDEKNYAGPMGMGLVKSYKTKNNIVCFYNTIKGYQKLILKNKLDCPSDFPK